MKKLRITSLITLVAVCVALAGATADAATLSDKDKQFLAGYEKAHTALVADDLSGAKAAAGDLGTEGAELSKSASLESLKGADFEQSFLQQMIQHHRSGIEMAKLASAQTTRTELRDFAAKMIALQQQEIDKMSGWLKSWYNISPKEVANEAADK